jgi:tetratricopeptide (TPR) repeat protein
MSLINQALEYEPNNSDFLYTKGLVYYKQGKTEEAIEILNKAWDWRPVYEHDHFSLLKEVEQTLASQNN